MAQHREEEHHVHLRKGCVLEDDICNRGDDVEEEKENELRCEVGIFFLKHAYVSSVASFLSETSSLPLCTFPRRPHCQTSHHISIEH